jgi:hypothetical protein
MAGLDHGRHMIDAFHPPSRCLYNIIYDISQTGTEFLSLPSRFSTSDSTESSPPQFWRSVLARCTLHLVDGGREGGHFTSGAIIEISQVASADARIPVGIYAASILPNKGAADDGARLKSGLSASIRRQPTVST